MCIVLAVLCMFLSEAQKKFRFGVSWPSRPGMGLGDGRKKGVLECGQNAPRRGWNSKPFLGCLPPLTTGESGKGEVCAPSSPLQARTVPHASV